LAVQGDGEEVRALKVWIGTIWTFRKCPLCGRYQALVGHAAPLV
jgi:hypothetical protein